MPQAGRWLWTCRDGFEAHLFEELAWAGAAPRLLGAGLVESAPVPAPPAFARTGFPVAEVLPPGAAGRAAAALARLGRPLCLQAWTADTLGGNALAGAATTLAEAVAGALPEGRLLPDAEAARAQGGLLAQLCLASPEAVALGWVPAAQALSLAPGGRRRMRRPGLAPSRAAMKLEEALDTLGVEPGKGELCVDLGAAPGGWTERLLSRGSRVVAVDPARLMPSLLGAKRLRHVQESAFDYAPEEPADWLFCDMAWRPLEVAQLLAKWGRRGWALQLVANVKLPMKDKNPTLLRVRHVLEAEGGWREVRMRQLYHDRDEVTVTARAR